MRKELLVATRHILATDFREGFFKHVDIFLDENLLVGTSRGAGDSLRPLAYSEHSQKLIPALSIYIRDMPLCLLTLHA